MTLFATVALALALAFAYAAQLARWLRVLQREHYEPRSMTRFLGRWSAPPVAGASTSSARAGRRGLTVSHLLVAVAVVAALVHANVVVDLATVSYGLFCPVGLSIRGRSGPLRFTPRLRVVAASAIVVALAVSALGPLGTNPFLGAVVMVWAVPPVLDGLARLLAPVERRRAQHFVDLARRRLEVVRPVVVAITGSYGKTSTKNYLAQLLTADGAVVASPRSFNNRAGLSRAVNENLVDGTRVFIAEMGTYGPGEIRDLTEWLPPDIAVVTAIGPVHLERMGSLEVIEAAKREITERAKTIVLNVDDVRLRSWVEELRNHGHRVVTAAARGSGDVRVEVADGSWTLWVGDDQIGTGTMVVGVHATNLACAAAASLELGVSSAAVVERLSAVTPSASRLSVARAPSGVVVVDDTFNANPDSARAALAVLGTLDVTGRRVVVTPGMVELGALQYAENVRLAERIRATPADLVVVGRTNALPLSEGSPSPVMRFDRRDQAVAWVKKNLRDGDAVLYLNDLPDHYP